MNRREMKRTQIALIVFIIGIVLFFASATAQETPPETPPEVMGPNLHYLPGHNQLTKGMIEKIVFYEEGNQQIIDLKSENGIGIASLLIRKLHALNLQAKCVFSEEDIQEIKQKDGIVELIFKRPIDITISQWVEPEERYHIPVDEKGYRILENVKITLFILEDRQGGGLEAHILVGHEVEGRIGYSCWAINIKEEGKLELDKTWIDEINRLVKEESIEDRSKQEGVSLETTFGFSAALSVKGEYAYGFTAYHVTAEGPDVLGDRIESELKWSLANYFIGINIISKWNNLQLVFSWLTNANRYAGEMKDSDWVENDRGFLDYLDDGQINGSVSVPNHPGLDIYSETRAYLDISNIFDINIVYSFILVDGLSIKPVLGYRYQEFGFSAYGPAIQYGYGPYPTVQIPASKVGEYKVVYKIPYLGLTSEWGGGNLKLRLNLNYPDWVTVEDEDTHLYPDTPDEKISKAHCEGDMYSIVFDADWQLNSAWALTVAIRGVLIDTRGSQTQYDYVNGTLMGVASGIGDAIRFTAWLPSVGITYRF